LARKARETRLARNRRTAAFPAAARPVFALKGSPLIVSFPVSIKAALLDPLVTVSTIPAPGMPDNTADLSLMI
jgi:hypothetical protein